MLSDSDLTELFRTAESDRVERKQSANDLDKIRQAICAFANDLPNHRGPGVVFVGQRDDLSCAALPINDALLLKLSNLRGDGLLLPFPTMIVCKKTLDGCSVAVIQVEPTDNPPVRCDGRTLDPRWSTARDGNC
jgi:ATP-dependent DNA helicase RecG